MLLICVDRALSAHLQCIPKKGVNCALSEPLFLDRTSTNRSYFSELPLLHIFYLFLMQQ